MDSLTDHDHDHDPDHNRRSMSPNDKPSRRYGASCSFCRRRKIKCDGARPKCVNCKNNVAPCEYLPAARLSRKSKDDDPTPAPLQPPISRKPKPHTLIQAGSSSTSHHPTVDHSNPTLNLDLDPNPGSGYSDPYSHPHSISPPKGYTVPQYPLPILASAPTQGQAPARIGSASASGSGSSLRTGSGVALAGSSNRSPPGSLGDLRPAKRSRTDVHSATTTQRQPPPQPLRPPPPVRSPHDIQPNHFASLTTSAFTLPPSSEPHRPLHTSPSSNPNNPEYPSIPGTHTPSSANQPPPQAQAQAWTQKALLLGPESSSSSSELAEGSGGRKRKSSGVWAGLNPNSPPVGSMTEERGEEGSAYSPGRSRTVGKGGVGGKHRRTGSGSGSGSGSGPASKMDDHVFSPSRRIRTGEPPSRGARSNEFTTRKELGVGVDPAEERKERDRRNELMARAAEGRHLERIAFDEEHMEYDGWPPDLVKHLLELHWNRQHHAFLITYRPVFMRDMRCGGKGFSRLLLNSVLYGVAKFSDRPELLLPEIDGGRGFLSRAMSLLGESLLQPDVTVVQALLLLCNSLGAQGAAANGPVLYLRIALTLIDELNLNHEDDDDDSEEIEIRRRVVGAAYIMDKIHSLYQGRAIVFPRDQLRVKSSLRDRYEELEQWAPFAYPGAVGSWIATAHSVTTWEALHDLCGVVESIVTDMYTGSKPAEVVTARLGRLEQDLEAWRDGLASHLVFNPGETSDQKPTPMIMSLHALYDTATILLHRPALESGRCGNEISAKSWDACTLAASHFTDCLRLYRATFTLRRSPYLISYATYVASTIHVRRIAAVNQQSTAGAEMAAAHEALRLCLDTLAVGAQINAAVERARQIIGMLMHQLNVEIPLDPPSTDPEPADHGIFQDLDIDAILRTFLSDSSATYSVPVEWRTGEEANWPVPVDFPRIDPLMGYIYNGEFLNPLDGSFC